MRPVLLSLLLFSLNCYAEEPASTADTQKLPETLDLPLEKLMALSVNTSVNRRPQSVKNSAAAIFVISPEDIRRSGATNVPEVLRMVPGLQVAQIDANKWAITARGFNDRFSTKLLVMIDGRTIYTPIFSGVFWNREDTPLQDVERIEVIRGAGASMWGANAMNGVINIITKSAKNTQGGLLSIGGGKQEQGFATLRYGDKIGPDFYYSVYGKGFLRDDNRTSNHKNAQDHWENYQGGIKTEWYLTSDDTLSTQGDIYHSRTGDVLMNAQQFSGGNMQTRWKHKFSETSETLLQLYYKQDDINWHFNSPFNMHEKTVDISFQHNFSADWFVQHDLVWGLGYRYYNFTSNNSERLIFNPSNINLDLFSGFVQDEISLLPDELKLTLGTRVEHNDFTGIEVQPNIRLIWTPDDKQSIWGSISRAVSTPTLAIANMEIINTAPAKPPRSPFATSIIVSPNANPLAETVLDYEIGYRIQPTSTLSFDTTAFYNQYERLTATESLRPYISMRSRPPALVIPSQFTNKMVGETLGVEFTTQWQAATWLKMQGSYSFLKSSLHTPQGISYSGGAIAEKKSPQQQVSFRTQFNLPYNVEWDTTLRYLDSLPYANIQNYLAFDMRLGWKPLKNLDISLIGQNLFDNQHPEFQESQFRLPQVEIKRSVFGKITLSF